MLVEIDVVFEPNAIEVREHGHLRLRFRVALGMRAQILDQRLGVDFLLYIDWNDIDGEVL